LVDLASLAVVLAMSGQRSAVAVRKVVVMRCQERE
jgi:hypothetical protein